MKSSRQTATPQHRSWPRGNDRPHPKTPSSGQHPRRRFLGLAAGAAALPAVSPFAWAQAYPTRPIIIVVPFAPGGTSDVIARILAEHMRVSLGQPVIIENVTGASGNIGVGRVARAAGDGYTLTFSGWSTHVANGAIYALPYDLVTDFEPIALVHNQPFLIVAKKTMPAKDMKELIVWLKANPDKASQGHAGVGNPSHVAGVFFQKETGTRFQFVPYRGTSLAMQDLVAGQIDIMIAGAADCVQQVRAGTITAYAIAAKERSTAMPDVLTVDEAGLLGFYISSWTALWAPRGTPRNAVAKLSAAVMAALADANVRRRLEDLGQDVPPAEQQTPEALGAFHKAEIEKWWPIIKGANIKVE
jgi:tripartite-type tricarboxylate transporter receptor subunit TctC